MPQLVIVTNALEEILFTFADDYIPYMVEDGYEVHIIARYKGLNSQLEDKIPSSTFHYVPIDLSVGFGLDNLSRKLYEEYIRLQFDPTGVIYFPNNYYAKYFVKDPKLNDRCFVEVIDNAWEEIRWMCEETLWFNPVTLPNIMLQFTGKGVLQDAIHTSARNIIVPSSITQKSIKQRYNKDGEIIPLHVKGSVEGFPPEQDFGGNILYFGRIDPRKGINLLIQGLKEILSRGTVNLHIGGRSNFPSLNYSKYLSRIKNPRLHFYGPCEDSQKKDLYLGADLSIVPSTYETFARTVIESLRYGVPVLASDAVGAAYDLRNEAGIYLFRNNDCGDLLQQFTEVIERLGAMDKEDYADLRTKCFELSKGFTADRRAKKLLNLFSG